VQKNRLSGSSRRAACGVVHSGRLGIHGAFRGIGPEGLVYLKKKREREKIREKRKREKFV